MTHKKDVCEKNHIVIWSMSLGMLILAVLLGLILFVDVQAIRNPSVVTDFQVKLFMFIACFVVILLAIRHLIYSLARKLNRDYLRRFSKIENIASYVEAKPLRKNIHAKQKHAVLLLHGFTGSPQEFISLSPYLEQAGLSYLAPNIVGFGIDTTGILQQIRYNDWLRSVLDAYDNLAEYYEDISIVGHSLGSILAMYLSQQRKVKHLILTSPGLMPVAHDLKYKKLLKIPVLSTCFSWFLPYVPKPVREGRKTTSDVLDDSVSRNMFQYLAIPLNSIKQVFHAQDFVLKNLESVRYERLHIIYGRHDLTVDVGAFLDVLDKYHFNYSATEFAKSAHNILDDFDKAEVCFAIAEGVSRG